MQTETDQQAAGTERAISLAIKIAKAQTKGRHDRDDAISDALFAVASGVTDHANLENVVRASKRRSNTEDRRSRSLDGFIEREPAPAAERSIPDLWRAIQTLPARQAQVVIMAYWDDYTQEDIATAIGISQPVVTKYLKSAIANLRKFFLAAPSKALCRRGNNPQSVTPSGIGE